MLFNAQDTEDSGLAISDLMTALTAVFLLGTLLAIEKRDLISEYEAFNSTSFENNLLNGKRRVGKLLETMSNNKSKLHWDESRHALTVWLQFEKNDSKLTESAKATLNMLCPKLISIVGNHGSSIGKVIIRGHTDRSWSGKGNDFVGNMRVSYERAMNTTDYCLASLPKKEVVIASKFAAEGVSFLYADSPLTKGQENLQRRVEILFDYTQQARQVND
ncbi:hypothetical protein BGP78_21970 [Pseudoalteromonas sp. MSK9-3]|uniref:OmpA family protein n=1 Tax=Pseudoalteromonas sp. MSK9-3 TaxID=1897633 RepID=UPI000E6D1394|nr:OmpA family protein [Pseudoalteromonas sp. MSK9-3]RJE71146.1 hypothetical protein BGP78_21970 [Pseudoalteromonas sp. MSK9-3]